jgi:hypothetical protein
MAGAGTGPSTIRVTDRQTKLTYVDQGRRGRGAGDLEIIRLSLFNRRITTTSIGYADILCTTLGGGRRSCTGTYALPRGKLVVAGVIGSRLLSEVPIVGGTGLYNNARGSLVTTTTSVEPRREILVFRLVG